MDEKSRERILSGLRQAMITEADGHAFYSMAAKSVQDAKGRAVLERLAADERLHLETLKKQHEALVKTGALDAAVALPAPADLAGPQAIFSADIKGRLAHAGLEMSTLSIGIQLELNSLKYYGGLADAEPAGPARDFFRSLADWEKGHYESLLAQYDDLKEAYWEAAGFSPF